MSVRQKGKDKYVIDYYPEGSAGKRVQRIFKDTLKEWRRKDREAIAIHEGVSPEDMHLNWIDNSTVRHGNKIFAMYKHMVQVTYVEGINNKPQQVKVFDTVE